MSNVIYLNISNISNRHSCNSRCFLVLYSIRQTSVGVSRCTSNSSHTMKLCTWIVNKSVKLRKRQIVHSIPPNTHHGAYICWAYCRQ